jgi:hypothetical protein
MERAWAGWAIWEKAKNEEPAKRNWLAADDPNEWVSIS